MEFAETEDFQRVASLQRFIRNMKCHSTRSSLPRCWLSFLVASFLAHPGKGFPTVFMLCLTKSLSAFNAILSASVVALGVSYAIPPAINCLRGRKMLPPRPFVLPGPLGWICNLLGIAYVIVTTVLFLFPPDLPVTGSNMSMSFFTFTLLGILSHRGFDKSPLICHRNTCSHISQSILSSLNHPNPSLQIPSTYRPSPIAHTNSFQPQTTASSLSSSSSS